MKRRSFAISAALVVSASTIAAAGAPPAEQLADTGLFVAGSASVVRAGNLPFAPQYPLWTDGAHKRRWIHLPAGTSIDASRPDAWEFPAGTRFWKEFSFGGRRVETRMIERLADGSWRYSTYLWNEAQTEATLAPARGVPEGVALPAGARAARHVVPGDADCRACHEGRATPVLGFSALQLSPDRDPRAPHAEPVPAGGVDLRALVARGLVRGLPPQLLAHPPRIDAATPTARAALGYLHANCGSCHDRQGPLAPVGLALAHEVGSRDGMTAVLASVRAPSRFRIPAVAGDSFRVVPGRPELSALIYRMRSREPVAQMPPLGSAVVDKDGVALIERWIRENEDRTPNNKEKRP